MSALHAGEQLHRDQHEDIPYGFGLVRSNLRTIFEEILFIHKEIHNIYSQMSNIYSQMSTEEWYLEVDIEMQQMLEEENQKQQVIDEKISEQQNIEEKISATRVIDQFSDTSQGRMDSVIKGGVVLSDGDAGAHRIHYFDKFGEDTSQGRMDSVIKGGAVLSDGDAGAHRIHYFLNSTKYAEQNQKFYAEEDNDQNTDIAKVLFEETIPSPFNSGGTISLNHSSIITSSLQSGGTSLISPLIIPTSTTGGTTSAASSADNPYIHRFHFCMPLLLPRTGIGVPVSSPPPTASTSSTGVYALASQASSKNVADNPDNPDLGFDTSGTTPDNPRKPAPDLWAYVASRG